MPKSKRVLTQEELQLAVFIGQKIDDLIELEVKKRPEIGRYFVVKSFCNFYGMDKSVFYHWIRGEGLPSTLNLRRLCEFFGVSASCFMNIDHEKRGGIIERFCLPEEN